MPSRSSDTLTTRVPAAADLSSWSDRAWTEGVQVDERPALDRLFIRTRNNTYDITVLVPHTGEVLVRGGKFFPEPTRARVAGCSLGGSFLKLRGIYVGFSIELWFDGETVITSPVRSITAAPPESVSH